MGDAAVDQTYAQEARFPFSDSVAMFETLRYSIFE